ncbi:MAG: ABC transporter ATP-binding protein, partial [Planctomycetota bacterium]|nr:ABC transporter ATP-binding protein [Planctomycetota bacterium]
MGWLRSLLRAFRRPFRHLRRRWLMVSIGLALVPVHAAVMLWMPRLLGQTLDLLTAGAGSDQLAPTCWLMLGLAGAEAAARFVSRRLIIDASRLVEQQIKDELVAHIQRLPTPWFDKARTGDLTSRMTQDVELVRFVIGPMLLHGGSTLCLLPAGLVLMLSMDVPVALASLSALLAVFVAVKFVVPRLHQWSKRSQEAIAEVSQQAQEDFAGVRVIQQFDRVPRELAAMATKNRRYLLANLRQVRLRALMNALMHSTSGVVMLGVLLVGGHQVITGSITVGELFQFTGYLALMTFPLQILGWTIAMIPRAVAAGERLEDVFDEAPEDLRGARPQLRGDLEVRGLTFRYPGAERDALREVSFTLPAGQKLGLVGPIGSGKSTLLALLLRLYDPPRGAIFVDGHDALDLDPRALRALFALAPQEPFLFSDTVAANVSFDDPEVSDERRDEAVARAALDQDLPHLRDGIQTVVGERGVTLSGGQKQRVSLARAMLSDRPALLLDDTLSAVDANTERRILDGLHGARDGRTVIAATHRLTVTSDADLILVLEDGAVRDRGTHAQLTPADGPYAAAWRLQTEARALG